MNRYFAHFLKSFLFSAAIFFGGGLTVSILGQQATPMNSELRSDPELGFQSAARAVKIATTDQPPEFLRETRPLILPRAELRGHTAALRSAAFSPNGKWVVTASDDGTSRVWEAASGRELAKLQGHTSGILSATFSPNGKWMVTTSWDKTGRVWEVASDRQ